MINMRSLHLYFLCIFCSRRRTSKIESIGLGLGECIGQLSCVTKHHRLCGFNNRYLLLIVLQARSPRSRLDQVRFYKTSFPGLQTTSISECLHMTSSLCVCRDLSLSLSFPFSLPFPLLTFPPSFFFFIFL